MPIFDSLKFDGDLSPSEIMNKKIVGILRMIIVLITMYLQRIKFYINSKKNILTQASEISGCITFKTL